MDIKLDLQKQQSRVTVLGYSAVTYSLDLIEIPAKLN